MARILFCWELGGGSGHLGPFHTIARELTSAGHHLTLAVRDPDRAASIFGDMGISVVNCRFSLPAEKANVESPRSYPQILLNLGYGSSAFLYSLLKEWDHLFAQVDPDLVVADHAPAALLASLSQGVAMAAVGTGFVNPPPVSPLPFDFLNGFGIDRPDEELFAFERDEGMLLKVVNSVLERRKVTPLRSLGELFERGLTTYLTTLRELDPYASYRNSTYYGPVGYSAGASTANEWPQGRGPKIYGYLKPSLALGQLFDGIRECGCPTLITCDRMDAPSLQKLAGPHMRFVNRHFPIDQVARECDVTILNATHGVTCSMLLAGKPMLHLPHNYEQAITAQKTMQLGCAVAADRNDGLAARAAFHTLLLDDGLRSSAEQFSEYYRELKPDVTAERIAGYLSKSAMDASSRRS